MREMTADEVKEIQLQILDFAHEFCKKNNIKYWISGGTLLGAVRHKGYIPWDDDIDIGMFRSDYERLKTAFKQNNSNSRYQFLTLESENYHLPFGKIIDTETVLFEPDLDGHKIAINIDVVPYDKAPDDDRIAAKMFKKRDHYRKLYYAREQQFSRCRFSKKIFKLFLALFPKKYFLKKMVKNATKYDAQNTKRVGNFLGWKKVLCDIHAFDNIIPLEFEGKFYNAPEGYDKWLSGAYGDYMKLPPKEKQVTHHSYFAFWKD